ncbi:3-deoxy-D-manno-octulosonic acid transferase [Roseovarius dicentrarchi]|uniref:3-deoxy-D-manno-octulosonic acid transferase n=1 Tax=Roseovarius dicentrarchi TaxID=2250573 RepID=UPI001939584F|nr:3-deoxy-D-manno-octulosonic acid transferase [Roseovarius dicentrarchi]
MAHRPGGSTLLLRAYGAAARVAAPLAYRGVRRKLAAHGTDPARIRERLGRATVPRPDGPLMWLHAASVGESLSVLRLIAHMGACDPRLNFLLTSGTATSAQMLATRLPPRCIHQFAPLDSPAYLRRFFTHWHPDAAVFVESELWPNTLRMAARRGIPLALLNARISDRSARGWGRMPRTARALLGLFAMIHCQDARTAAHLADLGASNARHGANLKAMAGPLAFDAVQLVELQNRIGARPVWTMSSTHPGEEEVALNAHAALLRTHPDALLILAPRHPDRAEEIAKMIKTAGFTQSRRSAGTLPGAQDQVYLADTLGELGLWYALAPVACIAGSFVPVGGHNPYEAAHAGTAVLHGPLYVNFAQAYAQMDAAGAARQVADADQLADTLRTLLGAGDDLKAMRQAALGFANAQDDQLAELSTTLCAALKLG